MDAILSVGDPGRPFFPKAECYFIRVLSLKCPRCKDTTFLLIDFFLDVMIIF